MKELEKLIFTYKDFPQKGIAFKDLLEIIQNPEIFRELISKMSLSEIVKNSEAIISIDARGFIFGSAIAFHSSIPMIVARKPGKLPGKIIEQNYNKETTKQLDSITKSVINVSKSQKLSDDLTLICIGK